MVDSLVCKNIKHHEPRPQPTSVGRNGSPNDLICYLLSSSVLQHYSTHTQRYLIRQIISSVSNMNYLRQAVMDHRSRQKQELASLRTDVNRYRMWFGMPLLEDPDTQMQHPFIDKKTVPFLPPDDELVNMSKKEIDAWKRRERIKRRNAMRAHATLERKLEKVSLQNELKVLDARFLGENHGFEDIVDALAKTTIRD